MTVELRAGETLASALSGAAVRVDALIGEGGQGWTYRVTLDGRPFAMKWYRPLMVNADPDLKERLRRAIQRGAPSDQFLWPFDLVTRKGAEPTFGYLMRIRGESFCKISEVLSGGQAASFRAIVLACFNLAAAFSALHAKGLSYQDISAGNVFMDPATGAIQICDNDNVDIDGTVTAVGGTPGYQPPEMVLREAYPSRKTDLHALAVLLFELLHGGHPLRGARELAYPNLSTREAQLGLFGVSPRFVFDPKDTSNRPVPELHGPILAHWAIYPQTVRDLFVRAFTVGLVDPEHGRVLEAEWRRAMSAMLDAVQVCPACGAENFYDPRRIARREPVHRCWNEACGADLPSAPLRIGIRRPGARSTEVPAHVVVASNGSRLYGHHVTGGEHDFSRVAGVFEGAVLVNAGRQPWRATYEGETREVAPGGKIALHDGMRIVFDRAEGEVKGAATRDAG